MSTSLTALLTRLSEGTASLNEACTEVQSIAQHAAEEDITSWLTQIRGEVAAGRLEDRDADTLVHAMRRRGATIADTRSSVAPAERETTAWMPSESTAEAPSTGTLIRGATRAADDRLPGTEPSIANFDAARFRNEDTIRSRGSGEETLCQDDGAPMPTNVQPAPDVTRTLRAAARPERVENDRGGAPRAADRTEVIASRRAATLDEADVGPQGPLQLGSVVKNRFVLDAVLGKGGMGLVFGAIDRRKEEARDPNPRVALKVLNADFRRHPQSLIALQREARKAQTLAHPNVVTVFDFDRDGDIVFLTMELLEGRSLESMVREARGIGIGSEQALAITRGIAEGLAYAHRKGIVHSDLKPGNIFVTQDGTPKILDFGIARAVPSSAADDVNDEFDASVLGAYTEAYATDEMVEGYDAHPADDMYALGIIAYELLTGFHPYKRHSAPNARELGIVPEPLKGLKRKEAKAIESCLSFDRERRPQDAGEFLKLFRGITKLQQATFAVAAVLALTAGYFSYQNYVETSPSIAFSELSAAQQAEFRELMSQGGEAWTFFQRERISDALTSAIDLYAEAYRIHPRNREAVAALNQAAAALLSAAENDEQRREFARYLQSQSEHYRKHAPVVEAAR